MEEKLHGNLIRALRVKLIPRVFSDGAFPEKTK